MQTCTLGHKRIEGCGCPQQMRRQSPASATVIALRTCYYDKHVRSLPNDVFMALFQVSLASLPFCIGLRSVVLLPELLFDSSEDFFERCHVFAGTDALFDGIADVLHLLCDSGFVLYIEALFRSQVTLV